MDRGFRVPGAAGANQGAGTASSHCPRQQSGHAHANIATALDDQHHGLFLAGQHFNGGPVFPRPWRVDAVDAAVDPLTDDGQGDWSLRQQRCHRMFWGVAARQAEPMSRKAAIGWSSWRWLTGRRAGRQVFNF